MTDAKIEEAASLMFEANIAFQSSSTRARWTWDMIDEQHKQYWRNMAKVVANVFDRETDITTPTDEGNCR